jgi:hypothetical protein
MKRNLLIGGSFVALLVALAVAQSAVQRVAAAQAQNGVMAPRFEVDPTFPKPVAERLVSGSDDRAVGRCAGPRLDRASA